MRKKTVCLLLFLILNIITGMVCPALSHAAEMPAETASVIDPEAKAVTDEELLELFKSADPDTKNAAVSVLKGEKPQGGDMMSMFAGMMGGAGGDNQQNAESCESEPAEKETKKKTAKKSKKK